jgi:hypothetical protein
LKEKGGRDLYCGFVDLHGEAENGQVLATREPLSCWSFPGSCLLLYFRHSIIGKNRIGSLHYSARAIVIKGFDEFTLQLENFLPYV